MNRFRHSRHILFAAAALASAGAAQAADPVISLDMGLGPGQIIDASSFSWGIGRAVSLPVGTSSKREASAPILSDLTWTQNMDPTVPLLWNAMATGKSANRARMDLVLPAVGKANEPYLSILLGDALVTGVSFGNEGVSGSAAYRTFELDYAPYVPGKTSGEMKAGYDVGNGRATGPLTTSRAATSFEGLAPAASPGGGTSVYMRLGSGPAAIAGDSQARGYENWIALDSAQMGGGAGVSFSGGGSGAPGASKPSISEFTWSQTFDGSVPVVLAGLFSAPNALTATVEFVKDEGAGPVTYMQLVLEDAIFSGLSMSGSDAALPSVTGTMAFTSFSQTVWSFNEDGTRGESTSFGYDLVTQKTIGRLSAGSAANFGTGDLKGGALAAGSIEPPAAGGVSAPVPEPGTWAMMAAGLGLLAGAARRRHATPKPVAA